MGKAYMLPGRNSTYEYMGGCQNYGPFFGYPKYSVPYFKRDPKRDHNLDQPPTCWS